MSFDEISQLERQMSGDQKPIDWTRQRERTIDDLKRLFALVFSISFALAGSYMFERVKPFLTGERAFEVEVSTLLINFEMFAMFAATAAVFYYHDNPRGLRRRLLEEHTSILTMYSHESGPIG